MSELKKHYFCERDEIFRKYPRPLSNDLHLYYLKSEADKVIADLEESHKMEVEQLLIEIVKLKEIDSKNRSAYYKDLAMMAKDVERHKYKRCSAMAKWCRFWANYWECCEPFDCCKFIAKAKFFRKWHKRWLKIAEKFKEAK